MNVPRLGEPRFDSPLGRSVSDGLRVPGQIEASFRAGQVPIMMRYIDPNAIVRSGPGDAEDSVLCDLFARDAVHAATDQPPRFE